MPDIKRPFGPEQPGIELPDGSQQEAAEVLDTKQAQAEQRAGEAGFKLGKPGAEVVSLEAFKDKRKAEAESELDQKIEEEIAKNPMGWIKNVLAMGGSPEQITKGLEKAMDKFDQLSEEEKRNKAA
ncbi:MAG: hypothetical protein HY395_01435 [Candidatus Doudnabacteria bacterium]|nr:hypothetical protein [Candidatus Doudnabacteria bacterium]